MRRKRGLSTDVYVCTTTVRKHTSPKLRAFNIWGLRRQMLNLVYFRWLLELEARVHQIGSRWRNREEFQRERRMRAEEDARSDIYVCADDDCLITGEDQIIARAKDIMDRHPQFAILSLWPVNATIYRWTPGIKDLERCVDGSVYEDEEVIEHVSVGGIRFMRKGAMKEWPPIEPGSAHYDRIQCDYLRSIGYRCGYFLDIGMNHIGENYTTLSRKRLDLPENMRTYRRYHPAA